MRVTLDEIAESVDYGFTASACDKPVGPKFLRITDIQNGRVDWKTVPWCKCTSKKSEAAKLRQGDIVFARTGATTGKSYLISDCPEFTVFASYLIRVRLKQVADSTFVSHFFQTPDYWKQITKSARGVAQPGVNATTLKALQIPLPPLAEQKQIAAILDAADALRAKRRETLAQLDTLLQSTFLDMFGDPVSNPMGWKIEELGKKAKRITKGQSPKWQGFSYQEDGVLFVTSENVREGHLDISKPKFVQREFNDKLKSSELRVGDLLINLVGASIGRSCLFKGYSRPANINQAVGVVTLQDALLANYVVHLLQTKQGQSFLTGRIVEAARANISLKNLRELALPLPPIARQRRFATIVESVEKQKTRLRTHLAELDTLFASLQSRAFNGEL